MRNSTRVTLWIFSSLLAMLFVTAGIAKFINPAVRVHFGQWGYPDWFRVLIGGLEIGCGVLLLVPRLAWRAGLMLGLIMLGAAGTSWFHGETTQASLPASLLVIVSRGRSGPPPPAT